MYLLTTWSVGIELVVRDDIRRVGVIFICKQTLIGDAGS